MCIRAFAFGPLIQITDLDYYDPEAEVLFPGAAALFQIPQLYPSHNMFSPILFMWFRLGGKLPTMFTQAVLPH